MDIKEKIAKVKHKASRLAIKIGTAAIVATGTGATLTSCQGNNNSADKDDEKIENVEKTGVVFRTLNSALGHADLNNILFEDGTSIFTDSKLGRESYFLETGDTVTYEEGEYGRADIKAVRYKDGSGKNVNFGQIGKLEKDR